MTVKIYSFGLNTPDSVPPGDVVVIDVRHLRNPHSVAKLRSLDGRHPDVQAFVRADPRFEEVLRNGLMQAAHQRDIAFRCLGGRHRSVTLAEVVHSTLKLAGVCATVEHRCL